MARRQNAGHSGDQLPDGYEDDELEVFIPGSLEQLEANSIAALTNAARELLDYIRDTDVNELRIANGPLRIVIKRGPPPAPPQMMPQFVYPSAAPMSTSPAPAASPFAPPSAPAPAATPAEPAAASTAHAVTAPMVGTFFHAPSPKDKPFVIEGQHVDKGQTIGLIEAMKMMNEIDADVSGTVIKIVTANAQPVEYGQTLVLIEPDPES